MVTVTFREDFIGTPLTVSRTRSCRFARAFAECTCVSQRSQRYAVSAPQYHRALLFAHTSQAREALPAIAIAVVIDLLATLVAMSTHFSSGWSILRIGCCRSGLRELRCSRNSALRTQMVFSCNPRARFVQRKALQQSRHRNCRVMHLLTGDTNQLGKLNFLIGRILKKN